MEFSVRYVRLGEGNSQGPEKPVLGLRGDKHAIIIVNDDEGIHTSEMELRYFDKSAVTTFKGEPYPITRYLSGIVEAAKHKPISRKAKHVLDLATLGKPEAIDEDLLHSMPENEVPHPTDDFPDDPLGLGQALKNIAKSGPPKPPESPRKGKIAGKPVSGAAPTPKAAAITPAKRGRGRPSGSAGAGVIAKIAIELKVEQPHLRKACRAAGMSAPYTDEKAIRSAWRKHGK